MPPSLRCPSFPSPVSTCAKQYPKSAQCRSFTTTLRQDGNARVTRARHQLYRWLNSQGEIFRNPAQGHTNYLTAYTSDGQLKRVLEARKREAQEQNESPIVPGQEKPRVDSNAVPPETNRDLRPFPHNPFFISQPVLGDEMREKIWEAIMIEGKSVRDVSTEFSVEMSRVGAVVRLKEIEKEWARIGKPLAKPYAEAVMNMLPVTNYDPNLENRKSIKPHESINDLPIHQATGPQIFYPTSESRIFTRTDAAKIFDDHLLPADDRVPHPELTLMHKDLSAGLSQEEIAERQAGRDAEAEVRRLRREKKKRGGQVKTINTKRWEFKFTDVNVDAAGKDGRGHNGVGWRYGVPLMDRSRAQVKIPTKVE
ncbi:eukaryotic mitochondrial regulator protein-domain-containing protein [Bisporella sp. PMI_857]|nr:eukaryotic mitochondrial regulator protein-domain-containing protein [Bisporella sp. PMI_857]